MTRPAHDAPVASQLRRIHSPTVVGVPPINAFHDLVALPNGEVRHYGYRFGARPGDAGQWIYISSRDCGLTWQEYPLPAGCPGACVQSPWSGDFLTIVDPHEYAMEGRLGPAFGGIKEGVHVTRSSSGIDGSFTTSCIDPRRHTMIRQPIALRSRQRWIVSGQHKPANGQVHPVVFLSDDDGHNWRRVALDTVEAHKAQWPHKGVRWQNWACEPSIVELSTGQLWMLMRTSQDNHYESFSDDGGETWTKPAPSRFYGTITMPTFFRMTDGRTLLFWCNTTPLPELDHSTQAELEEWERQGNGEDFFTNRDAIHAAISEDDGATWIGFREIALNPLRNDPDFRSVGGIADCIDKSMHQSQAVELPEGKILLSHGQHQICRKLVIFDPVWLYEKERHDDFSKGLSDWCTFQYVKSLAGNYRGISGHCSYNRRPGALLIPSPDGEQREVLQIARHPDPRVVHENEGGVWNFPAGQSGQLRITLRLPRDGQGIRISLLDRWFNPVDAVAHHFAAHSFTVTADGKIAGTPLQIPHDTWQTLVLHWTDCSNAPAILAVGDQATPLPLIRPSANGLCYLHLQSIAEAADMVGTLVREVSACVE